MSDLQFFISLATACTFIGSLAVALYRVRVHHKVLFGEGGELNFITRQEKDEIIRAEWVKQDEKNKQIISAIEATKHEFCPVHMGSMEILQKVNMTQSTNIIRLNGLEEAIKESHTSREKIQDKLDVLTSQLATLIANTVHMASDIKDLKEVR